MRKTIQDVAAYLCEILVPETMDAYAVNPIFTNIATEEDIRMGVRAFRAFLVRLYDQVIATGEAYDTTTKVAHEYENRTSLSVYYPFLHHVKILLLNTGYQGVLSKDARTLGCTPKIFNEKLSIPKTMECLRFLADCGLRLGGIDLSEKKPDLMGIQTISVSYPDDPAMLTGMKAMAMAEVELGTLENQDIFLRCDYRAIEAEPPGVLRILKDTIKPLPTDIQRFVLELHERYLGKGIACIVEIKGFHIYFKYTYKRKDVFGINASLSNGYHINVKTVKMDAYPEVIQSLPPVLQDLVAKGYGCGRKREGIGYCDGGCRGMPIPLDASVLPMQDDIIKWFDQEIVSLQKK